jgi:ribonuclease P protein component
MLRLRSATDFQRVRRDGRSFAHPLVVLVACRRPAEQTDVTLETRVGFMAGRNVGSAVRRNRAKRRLREAVRAHAGDVTPGWDLIWIARAPCLACAFLELRDAVHQLLRRAYVLNPPAG